MTPRLAPLICLLLLLAACAVPAAQAPLPSLTPAALTALPTAAPTAAAFPEPAPTQPACQLQPVTAPTMPAVIPGYTELDVSTNLHMTGTPKQIDLESYRLQVTGMVDRPLSLAYDELRCLPRVESHPELVCPGFFKDYATWAGAPIAAVLELAGVQKDTKTVFLFGADGYQTFISLAVALSPDNFLAYEWNGEPLPILHGFPVRAVFPEEQGNKWVKWLTRIDVQ